MWYLEIIMKNVQNLKSRKHHRVDSDCKHTLYACVACTLQKSSLKGYVKVLTVIISDKWVRLRVVLIFLSELLCLHTFSKVNLIHLHLGKFKVVCWGGVAAGHRKWLKGSTHVLWHRVERPGAGPRSRAPPLGPEQCGSAAVQLEWGPAGLPGHQCLPISRVWQVPSWGQLSLLLVIRSPSSSTH